MPEKIKLLQLSPQFPFPEDDGGKIGIANIFKEFSRGGFDVTFFCFAQELPPKKLKEEAEKYGEIVFCRHSTRNTPIRILKSILFNHSIYIKKHINKQIANELGTLIKKRNFDIIHADHSCMAPLGIIAKRKLKVPLGLRLHNIEWTIWQRYAESLGRFNPKRYYTQQQAYELKRAERCLYRQADILFPITMPDKERALETAPNVKAKAASAGVDITEWKPDKKIERNPQELVLATTFKWIHNINAVKWFAENVMPDLKKKYPKVVLNLIGKNAPEQFGKYKSIGVNVLGYVEKVQPYYNRAAINISPLFVGGGIRIKILEAMAMELPVVASPVAAEGITAGEENGLIIAESKEQFLDKLSFLLDNPFESRKLGRNARACIKENYTWSKNVNIMIDSYRNLLNI